MENKPKQKKSRRKGREKAAKRFFTVLLVLVVIAVSVVTYLVQRQGLNAASVRGGITLTPESTEPPPTTEEATEPTTQTEESVQATQPEDPELTLAKQILSEMTLEEKICQLIFTTPEQLTGIYGSSQAAEGTRESLERYPVGGVIYERQNLYGVDQLSQMIANTQDYSKLPLFIGVEEEGGNVAPLTSIGLTEYYSPMGVYGEEENVQRVGQIGAEMAEDLSAVGINLNLAPVADVLIDPGDTEIGSRSFGSDPALTAELTVTMLQALQQGGVTACLKHFPGLASAEGDSRYGQAVSQRSLEELRQAELIPFQAGIDAGARIIIVSHMSLPNVLGDDTPCDLSSTIVTDLLRTEMGFEGLILTDSHSLTSITTYYDSGEAAVMALQAGCDVILQPNDLEEAVAGILSAIESGTLTEARIEESVLRILYLKIQLGLITQ